MTVLALSFWSQPQVVTDSWVELAGTVTLIAFVIGVYRHLECHVSNCHRLGRFQHGRYKLCRVHHPQVPSGGRITPEHVQAPVPAAPPEQPPAAQVR
ncbi:MAG TPA: hypothetical protein VL979_00355 [Solirubrobacteraceae bacterium]|nr:hypothetical protein [Solirubrobacteraceae bacterium]